MYQFIYFLIYAGAGALMFNGLYRMFGLYFDRTCVNRRVESLSFLLCYLINLANGFLVHIFLLNGLVSTLSVLALTFLYPGKFFSKAARALCILSLPMTCELVVYSLTLLLHLPQPPFNTFTLIGGFLAHLLFFILSLVFKQHRAPIAIPKISSLYWFVIFCLPGSSILLILVCCIRYIYTDAFLLLLTCWMVLTINLVTFYVLDKLGEYSTAYYERELLDQQNRAYRAEFDLMRESEQQVHTLRHDMKNHLAVLREYAAQGRAEELEQYLDTFFEKLTRPGYVHTGIPDIDSILNYKLEQAHRAGAHLTLNITLPEQFTADPFDLNVLLGNLLDNAVEGMERSAHKELSLTLQADRGVFYLKLSNSYDGVAHWEMGEDGPIYHSRKKGSGHGLGLQIVKRTVEKYHGQLQLYNGSDQFVAEALLYLDT